MNVSLPLPLRAVNEARCADQDRRTAQAKRRHLDARFLFVAALLLPGCAAALAQARSGVALPTLTAGDKAAEDAASISLSPALIAVQAKPGQAFTQQLTLWNNTNQKLTFQMEARDVVVENGKRVFLAAGETEGSIARFVVFNQKDVSVLPGSSFTETVTVTLPPNPGPRAIVCMFLGKTVVATRSTLAMTGSLGALVTFTLAGDLKLQGEPPRVVVDETAKSVTFREDLTNTGTDPVVPRGVLAVTSASGALIARLPISGQRLLPGESVEITAEHAGMFKAGTYKVMSLMENESAFLSNAAAFTIK